jgi:hypothetical protein
MLMELLGRKSRSAPLENGPQNSDSSAPKSPRAHREHQVFLPISDVWAAP